MLSWVDPDLQIIKEITKNLIFSYQNVLLLLYFLACLLALVFVYFSCSRRWLSSLCIRAMLATQMHSNWATQPTLYDPIWLYNVLLYSSTIFLDSNNRFYLLHTLFWGMYHVNLYWWFIIISILQVHIISLQKSSFMIVN